MPSRAARHVELLRLTKPLHRYALTLQPDANASFLLVHRAMARAFAEQADGLRPSANLECSLRADVQGSFEASHAHA